MRHGISRATSSRITIDEEEMKAWAEVDLAEDRVAEAAVERSRKALMEAVVVDRLPLAVAAAESSVAVVLKYDMMHSGSC